VTTDTSSDAKSKTNDTDGGGTTATDDCQKDLKSEEEILLFNR